MEDPFERIRKENRELRQRNTELFHKYADATLALGLATGHFPPFNEVTMKRAQDLLAARKTEWENRSRPMTASEQAAMRETTQALDADVADALNQQLQEGK